jgi:FecR-like protein
MRKIIALALGMLALPITAASGELRAGVVATVVGTATVARAANPEPTQLKLRDDIFMRDQITTGEQSFVRVLLGGKAAVSVREHSILRITERPSVSTVALAAGRIAAAVSKDRVKPGETVEIRMPNAIVAIRGTVVVAEVTPTPSGLRSTITILRGVVEVRGLDPMTDQPVGAPVTVRTLERITVDGGVPLPAPERITTDAARRLTGEFTVIPKNAPQASREASTRVAADLALRDVLQVTASTTSSVNTLGGVTAPLDSLTAPLSTLTAPLDSLTAPLGGVLGSVTAPLSSVTAPLDGVLGSVTAPLGGVLGSVTAPVSSVLGGVTAPLGGVLGGVTAPISSVTAPLGGVLGGVTAPLSSVTAPLSSVTAPVSSVTTSSGGLLGGVLGVLGGVLGR